MKTNKYSKEAGFTLAELLIVVAIIAVLVAVSIPIFASRIAKAKETVCINERTTMKHACVIEATSNERNWHEYLRTEGISEGDEATEGIAGAIMDYLEAHYSIDKFTCPSGGIITAKVNEEGNSVTFFCSKHDSKGGGGGGEVTLNDTQKAQKELEEAIKKFAKEDDYPRDNGNFLKRFFEKYPQYEFKSAKPAEVLSKSQIDKWADAIKERYPEKDTDGIVEKYINSSHSVVPYWYMNSDVITYYTDKTAPFSSSGTCHTTTNMICYKGNWYGCTKIDDVKKGQFYGNNGVSWLKDPTPSEAEFEKLANKNGWVKLS